MQQIQKRQPVYESAILLMLICLHNDINDPKSPLSSLDEGQL
jgi:hypothetical protein